LQIKKSTFMLSFNFLLSLHIMKHCLVAFYI
jgi:hypothetical protein